MFYRKRYVAEQAKRLLDNDTTLKEIELRIKNMSMFHEEGSSDEEEENEVLDEEKASAEAFTRAMETCSLTNLRLKFFYVPNILLEETFRFITRMVQCNCIHDLYLWGEFSIDHFASIVETLSRNSAIQKLEISECPLGKESVTAISKMLRSKTISLKSLLLDGTTILAGRKIKMGDEGCSAVLEALRTYPALKVLKISSCGIGIEGAKSIGNFLRSGECTIEELRICMNPISDEGCFAVMEGLLENSSIKVLGMGYCDIGKEGAEAIANVLSSGKCAIEELNLQANIDIRDEGCVVIMEALRNNNSVCKLGLCSCNIGYEGMKSIANVLQSNHDAGLRNLSLWGNTKIGLEGFKALANALSQNSSLEYLVLSSCNVRDQGCILLMDGLSQNSSVKSIDLGSCFIRNEGGKAVANFLKSNTGSMQEIILSANFLDEESLFEIANALHFNTHLTKLSLGDVGQEEVWKAFYDAVHYNYSLQELDMWVDDEDGFWDYMEAIEKTLDDNKKLGPVKAEMHKTGLFPFRILPCLTTASCFVEALSKVASLEHLSPLFDLVCARPMLFDLDYCVAERPPKKCRME